MAPDDDVEEFLKEVFGEVAGVGVCVTVGMLKHGPRCYGGVGLTGSDAHTSG